MATCSYCGGTGNLQTSGAHSCARCNGVGTVFENMQDGFNPLEPFKSRGESIACPSCGGSGNSEPYVYKCAYCNGSGVAPDA